MLTELKAAAEEVGFSIIIATSDRNINDQLNRIVRSEELPLALCSWDLDVNISFDDNGLMNPPTTTVTLLLIDKAESLEKIELEQKAEEMGDLFIKFIKNAKNYMTNNTNVRENPITGITFTYVPSYGSGKHSGVLAKFTMQLNTPSDCDDVVDFEKPVITSGTVGVDVVNLGGENQIVYNITATDNVGVTSFRIGGVDSANLTLNGSLVSLNIDPDFDIKDSYTFSVEALDAAGNVSNSKQVTFGVSSPLDAESPVFVSGDTGNDIYENAGANQLVYTIIANDNVGVVSYAIGGLDASFLSLTNNEVTLVGTPDFEEKSNYSFDVIVSDEAGNVNTKTITFSILDLDELSPIITSSNLGLDLVEGTGVNQTIYTITSTDNVGVVSYAIGGADGSLLSVNSLTGVVTLIANPDYDTKSSYSFDVTATDAAGNVSNTRTVTFSITRAVSYILDTYTNSSVAYSLRKLSSSTTNVVRVRRDSDDTEQDFSADEINDGTLTTFVGSGDGFISIIYDQSGNSNNGVQTNNSSQPKIVESGSLVLDNGKPSMLFSGGQSFDFTPFEIDKSNGFHSFYINTYLGQNNHRIISMVGLTQDYTTLGVLVSTRQYGLNGENIITLGSSLNGSGVNELNVYKSNSTSNTILRNGNQLGTSPNSSTSVFTPSFAKIGDAAQGGSNTSANGRIKEIIIFNNNQDNNDSDIQSDMNVYYSVY